MLTHLIVRKSAILIDRVDLSNFTTDRFALEYSFLFTFGEQRYFVVNILQNDIDGRFRSELLGTIVLRKRINFILRVPSIFYLIPLFFFFFFFFSILTKEYFDIFQSEKYFGNYFGKKKRKILLREISS